MITFLFFALSALSVHAEQIHCRWDPDQRPSTYLVYDTDLQVAETLSGWNEEDCPQPGRTDGLIIHLPTDVESHQCMRTYEDVKVVSGFPPFGKKGFSLMVFGGDVLLAHLRLSFNGLSPGDRSTVFPFHSYWGDPRLPGYPDRDPVFYAKLPTRGVCWTTRLQPVEVPQ